MTRSRFAVCSAVRRVLPAGATILALLLAVSSAKADDPLVAPPSSIGHEAPNVTGASTIFQVIGTQGTAQAYQCVGKVDFGHMRVENQFGILIWDYTGIKWGTTVGLWNSPPTQFNQKVAFTDRGNGVMETVTAIDEGFDNEILIQAPGGTGKITLSGMLTTQLAIERTFAGDSTATSFRTNGQVILLDQQGQRVFAIDTVRAIDANNNIHYCNIDWVQVPGGFTFKIVVPNTWLTTATYPIRVDPLIGVPAAVSPESLGPDFESAVAFGAGQHFVVWTSSASVVFDISAAIVTALTTSNDIYARRLAPDGTPLGPTFAVATGTPNQRYARVAFASGMGGIFVVAHKEGNSVVIRRYNAAGILLSTATVNNPMLSDRVTTVDIASNGVDRFCITWTGYMAADTFRQTWAEVRDVDGSVVTDDTIVGSSSGTLVHARPTVVWNPSLSQWLFLWEEYDGSILTASRQVEGRAFNATLSAGIFPETLLSTAAGSNYDARADWSPTSGEYLVVFTNNPPMGPTNVLGRRVSGSDGALLGTEFLVEAEPRRSTAAAVKWVPNSNRWLAVFELNATGVRGVYGQTLMADGTRVSPLFKINDGTDFAEREVALTYDFTVDHYLATWTDGTPSVQDIWAAPLEVTPPLPPGPIATSNDGTSITLSWPKGAEIDLRGYFVGVSTTPGGPYTTSLPMVLLPGAGSTVSWTMSGAVANTRYYYLVTAVDTHGNVSDRSTEASEIIDTIPPAAPTGLSGTAGDSSVALTWTPNTETDLAGYDVYFRLSTETDWTKHNTALVATTAYTVTGLTNELSYDFSVAAVDTEPNRSTLSAVISVTPGLPPSPPKGLLAFSDIVVGPPGGPAVVLVWDANTESDILGYNAYVRPYGGTTWAKHHPTPILETTWAEFGLPDTIPFEFMVTAVDDGGLESGPSNIVIQRRGGIPAATAPGAVIATAGNHSVALSWTPSTGDFILGYDVFRAEGDPWVFTRINSTPVIPLSFTDVGLVNGTTYYYRIAAIQNFAFVNGHYSEVVSATPVFPAPTALTLVSTTGMTATMSWTGVTAVDLVGYIVYRGSTPGGPYLPVTPSPIAAVSYVDTGLSAGTYYWVVKAKSATEESAPSNEITATLSGLPPPAAPSLDPWNTRKTRDTTPRIKGTTGAFFVVKLYEKEAFLGEGTADDAGAFDFSVDSAFALSEEDHVIQATAQDPSTGEVSGLSSGRVVTIDLTAPATPTGVRVVAGNGWAEVSWNANSEDDLLGYNLYRLEAGEWVKKNIKPLANAKYLDKGLTNGTPYEYRVTAVDDTVDY